MAAMQKDSYVRARRERDRKRADEARLDRQRKRRRARREADTLQSMDGIESMYFERA